MNGRGFSLMELIIALAVGSIIVGIGLGGIKRMESSGRARQTATDMNAIREAGLRYHWRNNSFPCCWSQFAGYLSPRLISSPVNRYGYPYTFSGSGVRFQVSTALPDSVPGDLGLAAASRTGNTLTAFGVVETGPADIASLIYQKELGWIE